MANRDLSVCEGQIQGRELLDLKGASTKFVKIHFKVFGVLRLLLVPGSLHNRAEHFRPLKAVYHRLD